MAELTVSGVCPPRTGTVISFDKEGFPIASARNVEARIMSSVVTPNNLLGI